METIALIHAAATAVLAGIAGTVQIVVYPAFALVPDPAWVTYHTAHTHRVTILLAAPWAIQVATLFLLFAGWPDTVGALFLVDAVLVGVPLVVSLLASRLHARSDVVRQRAVLRRLLWLNAVRLLAWMAGTATALSLAGSM